MSNTLPIEKLDEILEGYANNPSNANKYRHRLIALLEDKGITVTYEVAMSNTTQPLKGDNLSSAHEETPTMFLMAVFARVRQAQEAGKSWEDMDKDELHIEMYERLEKILQQREHAAKVATVEQIWANARERANAHDPEQAQSPKPEHIVNALVEADYQLKEYKEAK